MQNEKRASDDETKKNQEHRNIATLSLQLRSYKKSTKLIKNLKNIHQTQINCLKPSIRIKTSLKLI